jgi:glycosyltransferase involved in cell wall biosynthesis
MKLLCITSVYPIKRNSNLGIFVKRMVEKLTANGFEVDILLVRPLWRKTNPVAENVSVLRYLSIPYLSRKFPKINRLLINWSIWYWVRINKEYFNVYDSYYFKFLYPVSFIIDYLPNKPKVLDMGESFIKYYNEMHISKYVLDFDLIIARNVRNYNFCISFGAKNVKLISNMAGTNFKKLDRKSCLGALNINDSLLNIGFVGSKSTRKGYDFFVDLYHSCKGKYGFYNATSDSNDKLGIKDLYIPNEKMQLFYNAMDIIIIPSRFEGSSNVLAEAMACECIIVINKIDELIFDSISYSKLIIIDIDMEDTIHNLDLIEKSIDNLDLTDMISSVNRHDKYREIDLINEVLC